MLQRTQHAMVFPKQHSAEVHADHAAHVHKHFDLSLMGMALEGWILVGVVFAVVQVSEAAAFCAQQRLALRPAARAQFVRAGKLYDRLVKKPVKND